MPRRRDDLVRLQGAHSPTRQKCIKKEQQREIREEFIKVKTHLIKRAPGRIIY